MLRSFYEGKQKGGFGDFLHTLLTNENSIEKYVWEAWKGAYKQEANI